MPAVTRVFIAEDHDLFAYGMSALINAENDMSVVGIAHDGRDLREQVKAAHARVLLLDLEMPYLAPHSFLEQALADPDFNVHTIIVSSHLRADLVHRLTELNVAGYLLKQQALRDLLVMAIRAVLADTPFYGREVVALREEARRQAPELSSAEIAILRGLRQELTLAEIARQLGHHPDRIYSIVRRLRQRLDVRTNPGLVLKAEALGLLPENPD